jgi:hypothetical protein
MKEYSEDMAGRPKNAKADEPRDPKGRFLPGNTGCGGGRPRGSRNHLSELALSVLCEDFAAHGQEAIEHMRSERPAEYVRVIAMLLPRQLQVQERTEFDELENMSAEELKAFINNALKSKS